MPLPTQIQLSNTFGQWVNATNAIIQALGNTSEYILVTQTASPAPSTGNVSINGTMTVVNVTANGVLTVFANSSLNGAVTLHNTASIVGAANALSTLGVTGTFTALNQVVVGANANFDSGTLFVDAVNNRVGVGNTVPTHALRVQGTASINGAFTADTTTSLGGAVNALSTLGVTGAVNAFSTLGVTGAVNALSTLGVSGAVNALSTVGISGAANALSTLGVTGAVNAFSTVGISGAVNALSTLGVAGAVNALSTLGITGATNALSTLGITGAVNALSTLGVSGIFTAAANSTLTGAVTMSNTLSVTGNVTFSNTLAVTGNVTFSNTLAVTGNVTFSNTLAVTGNVTFSRDVTISGNLTISGTTTYINTTTLNIGDNIITLNADLPGASAPTENAGFEINRGSSANVALRWNETTDKWDLTSDGTTYVNVATIDITSNASNITSGSLSYSRLATTTTGRILIANTLGNIEALAMSGDISIDGTGVTTIGAGKVNSTMILDGTIMNADINGSAAIAHSKLASITAGHLLMGNAASGAEALAMSGDVTISSAGVTTIGTGKVTSSMILDGTIVNADISGAAAITYNKLATATAGTLLMANATGNVEAIAMSGDVTISNTGVTTIGTGKVNSTMILDGTIVNADINGAAAIAHSKLAGATAGSILMGNATGNVEAIAMSGDVTISSGGVTAIGTGKVTSAMILNDTIANTDISPTASIQYSKLALTGSITNADLAGSIALTKLTSDTSTALGVGTLELGHASDTTLSRSSAGVLAVEGVVVPTISSTHTLTNKTLTDSTTYFADDADSTKKMQFQLSGITTATTRTLTIPNVNGTIITNADTGTVNSTMILAGTIANTSINDSANITRTKISGNAVTEGTASTINAKVVFSGGASGLGRLVLPVGTNLWAT